MQTPRNGKAPAHHGGSFSNQNKTVSNHNSTRSYASRKHPRGLNFEQALALVLARPLAMPCIGNGFPVELGGSPISWMLPGLAVA